MSYETAVKLTRLLSRVQNEWGHRGSGHDDLAVAMLDGNVTLTLVRVPQDAVRRGLELPVYQNARERDQHQQLKNIGSVWLGSTAVQEHRIQGGSSGFRFDVFDPKTLTVIECGHTEATKILSLGLDYEGLRILVLPFRHRPLTPETPLTGVEFHFDPDYIKAHDEAREAAMRRAFASLSRVPRSLLDAPTGSGIQGETE